MILKKALFSLFILIGFQCVSQTNEVLFSIDSEETTTAEFVHVYDKNIDIVANQSQKGIENYLNLYINYKLKVMQAVDLGLDTVSSYKKELSSYKKQIMAPYLRDDEFIDKLVKEAYDRSLIEINASHILIKVKQKSEDTIVAFNKINEASAKIISGDKFEDIAVAYSEDRSVASNKGNLGYFSVFDMVYPFENAIYRTKKNKISAPFRTRFGYHIIYVHDIREARGEVQASHIMIKEDSISSRTEIDKLYQQLLSGEDFSTLAKSFSDDKYSAEKGGDLGRFGSGKMVQEFEDVIFALQNIGDFSKPFKTQFGWHIVKLIDKFPVESFEIQEKNLTAKVKRGDRASIVSNSIVFKIKDNYAIVENRNEVALFESGEYKSAKNLDNELMTLEEASISSQSLVNYLDGQTFTVSLFEKFKNYQILEYYKLHLEETNQEFAFLFQEYKEGLLLFELMQQRIWNKSKDTIGLDAFFETHKNDYVKPQTVEVVMVSSIDKKEVSHARKLFNKKIAIDSIKKTISSNVLILEKTIKISSNLLPEKYESKIGTSNLMEQDGKFVVVNTLKIFPKKSQELDEVRGRVLNDYQDHLEKLWVAELHSNYKVEINTAIVEKLIVSYNEE